MSLFRLCVRFAAFSGEFPISHLSSSLVAVPSASVFMHPLYRSYRNKASEFHIFVHILFISCADRVVTDGVKGLRMRLVHLDSITVDCRDGQIDPRSQASIQISAVFAVLERSSLRACARPSSRFPPYSQYWNAPACGHAPGLHPDSRRIRSTGTLQPADARLAWTDKRRNQGKTHRQTPDHKGRYSRHLL